MSEVGFADGDTSFTASGNDAFETVGGNHFELLVRQVHEYRNEIETLSDALQNERRERNQMEKEAIDILRKVKDKYESKLRAVQKMYEERFDVVKEKTNVEFTKMAEKSESHVHELVALKNKYEELTNELKNAQKQNDSLKNQIERFQSDLESSRVECNSFKLKLSQNERRTEEERRKWENEKCHLLKQVSSLNETVKKQESSLKLSTESDVISQKIKEFLSRNDIIGLEKWKCYEDCKKENLLLAQKLKEFEMLNETLKQRVEEIEKNEVDFKSLKSKLQEVENNFRISKEELLYERNKSGELSSKLTLTETENNDLQNEIETLKISLEKKDTSLNKLKAACENFDSQAQYLETLNEVLQREKQTLTMEKQELTIYSQMLQQNMETLRSELNDEKKKYDEILQEIEICRGSSQKETEQNYLKMQNLEEALNSEIRTREEYREQAECLQEQVNSKSCVIEDLLSRIDELENELMTIKEEAATHITTIRTFKMENVKLCHALEESLSNYEKSQSRIDLVVNEMDTKEAEFEREKLKLQETINQQLKLIDFLQSKSEKQKKPWFTINSPKPNVTSQTNGADIKETEAALQRERRKNRLLTEEIEQTKCDLRRCESQIKRCERNFGDNIEQMNLSFADDIKINNNKSREIFKLSCHNEDVKTLSPGPSAPPLYAVQFNDCEATSTTSSLTTDNNDCDFNNHLQRVHSVQLHDNRNEFTFTDSILAELSE